MNNKIKIIYVSPDVLKEHNNLALLADSYLQNIQLSKNSTVSKGVVTFQLKFSEGKDVLTQDISIYTCNVETAGTLIVDDLKLIPLTRCPVKPISKYQKEYISFYGSGIVQYMNQIWNMSVHREK